MDVTTSDAAFDPREVMEQLDRGRQTREFPREAIAVAREHRELMIPALLQCLEDALALVADGEKHDKPALLALCLLTEFHAGEAWPAIRRMLLLPDDGPFGVVGDGIHEIVQDSIALFVLSAPDGAGEVVRLAQSPEMNLYCRVSVASSVCRAYSRGVIDRDTMISAARSLLTAVEADHPHGDEYRGHFIATLLRCRCHELRQEIEDLFTREMVDNWVVSTHDVQSMLDRDKEPVLRQSHDRLPPIDTYTDQLQHWVAFRKPAKRRAEPSYKSDPLASGRSANETNLKNVDSSPQTITNAQRKVGRNEPCPCGSGKKFKKCCMRL